MLEDHTALSAILYEIDPEEESPGDCLFCSKETVYYWRVKITTRREVDIDICLPCATKVGLANLVYKLIVEGLGYIPEKEKGKPRRKKGRRQPIVHALLPSDYPDHSLLISLTKFPQLVDERTGGDAIGNADGKKDSQSPGVSKNP
jgi:hypothetical protein